MTPYYQDEWVTLYHADAREVLPDLTADVLVTDPPYGIGWNADGMAGATQREDIAGDEDSALAEWVIDYWQPGPMIVFGANHFPHALTCPGQWVCWDKRLSLAADRMFGSPFELAWHNTAVDKAGVMYRVLHGGVVNGDGGGIARQHPTQKPAVLFRQILSDLVTDPDAVIVDPFAGSGTTLRAAKDLGRTAIGVEIVESYCEAAAVKCGQEVLDLGGHQ